MHDPERGVAVLDFVDNHPQRTHIIDFGKLNAFLAHLVPDAVDVLGSPVHLRVVDTHRFQFTLQALDGVGDELFALGPFFIELLGDLLVRIRIKETERQVFQFPLQFPNTKPIGERRIQLQRFARHLYPQVVRVVRVVA